MSRKTKANLDQKSKRHIRNKRIKDGKLTESCVFCFALVSLFLLFSSSTMAGSNSAFLKNFLGSLCSLTLFEKDKSTPNFLL